jgi:hypothetical protein
MKFLKITAATALLALGAGGVYAAGSTWSPYSPQLSTFTGAESFQTFPPAAGTTSTFATTALMRGQANGVNAQTGTTYTIAGCNAATVGCTTDMGKLVTFSNTSAVAVTLPAATTVGFEAGRWFDVENKNSGAVTITPTTSTINGAATLVLSQNQGARIYSDGTNYQAMLGGAGSGITVLPVSQGGTGATTLTAHGSLIGEGTGAIVAAAVGATGTIYAGTTGADPAFTATPSGLTSLEATTLSAGLATGTAGTVAVYPGTTTTGDTTLTATANSGNTVTNINTAAQAGARTYTVPDQGGNANFLLTGSAQSTTDGMVLTPVSMTSMRTAAGLMMTASASGTNFGLTYTPGTTAILIGTATSSSTTGDVAAFDFVLPPNYIAGTNVTLNIACYYTNTSSTASVHTMTGAAYLNTTAGLQGASLIGSGAVTCPITTASVQPVTITGTTLVPGSLLTFTLTAAVTNGGGASTEWLAGVSLD